MAGRPKSRKRGREATVRYPELAAIYAEKWTSLDAMRTAMVQNGIVEHGISPYDCIQRAVDDTTTDYLLLKRHIEKDATTVEAVLEHPLYDHMEHMRDCMVRYSTMAAQYDIQNRQLKIGESRIALLSATLREVLMTLGLPDETIKQIPAMLIQQISSRENITPKKADALAEILANDSEVEVIDADVIEEDQADAA